MNELIEDYQRKINSVNELLKDTEDYDDETINRLKTKVGCYRSMLTDIKRALNIDFVSGLLPTVTEVSDKCEQDIKSFLNTNTEDELKHYRIAYRRSFEFVIRHIDYNR